MTGRLKSRALAEIDAEMVEPDFWDNQERAQAIVEERKSLNSVVTPLDDGDQVERRPGRHDRNGGRGRVVRRRSARRSQRGSRPQVEELKLKALLNGRHDAAGAIMSINARDGGTDANDWAEMLLRMYTLWAQKNGYSIELLERQDNEQAGISHAAIAIRGPMAYGYLRGETGMHRLVRISPFNAEGKRQTSFAAIDVSPEIAGFGRRRDRSGRCSRGCVPRERRRRSARQQDVERDSADAPADEYRRAVPERAVAAQEPGDRLEDAPRADGPGRGRKTRSGRSGQVSAAGQSRLRLADSQLLPAPRSARERRPHEVSSMGNFHNVLDGDIQGFLDAVLRWRAGQPVADDDDE